ncbi:MAG TPA: lysylphosphatidylglycerol synthase transmembrane domain-containing protein [Candidatus Omnitrophota bacterium]|nr:lysylphosphatidylglycerol synthase transmembrane domain-containing protein [Candidatus Omnitrophota bacterium]HPD84217.1 lysylphosphatidylglycerol synthase transmembrane domain-containing protein [Candidatus Omnitrophota bacterium]HRZ03073.1 lysylphosphatidylglycerol synthase transmembrane domain-containing protein [Candidatus Omnitrophota bacterium]
MALNEKLKNVLSLLLRIGLSVLLLAYLFSKIDTSKMLDAVKNADLRYFFAAMFIFIAINFLLLFRWTVFIRALGLTVPFKSIANCFFIGLFFNLFLPSSTGGDIVKTIGLFRDTPEKAKVVASVVVDRLSGFASIVLVALVSFAFGYRILNDNSLLVSIAVLALFCFAVILVLFNEKLFSFVFGMFNRFPKIKEKLMSLHYSVALLKGKPQALLKAVALSCLSQTILAFIFSLLAKSFHQDIPVLYFLIFVPILCVISSLPSIGGLGVRDAGGVYLFAKIGVESSLAVSITLISFLFMVIVGLLGGIVYIFAMPSKRPGN